MEWVPDGQRSSPHHDALYEHRRGRLLERGLPFEGVNPGWSLALLGIGAGAVFTIGQWFLIMAYRQGDASVIAPFFYAQLIWGGLFGFWVFAAIPDAWTILGGGIIVASGLCTAYRARARALGKTIESA